MSKNAISHQGSGTITLTGTTRVAAGPYGAHGIELYQSSTVKCLGESRIYATNENRGVYCIHGQHSGTVKFSSTGYFYCTGAYVTYLEQASGIINVTKGHFVSRVSNNMFRYGGTISEKVGGNDISNKTFYYLQAYNSMTNKSVPNCYYYEIGV